MKTKLFIFIALVTGILLATAEERPYRSIFEDGHTWITYYSPNFWSFYSDVAPLSIHGYIVDGDTVIEGKKCKRICDLETRKTIWYGFEENKKVYLISPTPSYELGGFDDNTAFFLADFSVSKGDSIEVYDEWSNKTYYIPCTDEDYIDIDGEVYRRITLNNSEVMIEGVGWCSIWNSIWPPIGIPTNGCSAGLIRSYQNGKWVKSDDFSKPGLPLDSVVYNPNREVR